MHDNPATSTLVVGIEQSGQLSLTHGDRPSFGWRETFCGRMLAETKTESQSMETDLNLVVLRSFDFIITTSTKQSDVGSMSVSINRNGYKGTVFVLSVIWWFYHFNGYVHVPIGMRNAGRERKYSMGDDKIEERASGIADRARWADRSSG